MGEVTWVFVAAAGVTSVWVTYANPGLSAWVSAVLAVVAMGWLLSTDPLVGAYFLGLTSLLAYQLGHVRPRGDPQPPDPWRHFSGGGDD